MVEALKQEPHDVAGRTAGRTAGRAARVASGLADRQQAFVC